MSQEDCERWAFSDVGPWRLTASSIQWLDGLEDERAAAHHEIPEAASIILRM